MLDILIQRNFFRQFVKAAVNPDTDITAPLRSVQHLFVLSLSSSYHRSQKLQLCPLGQRHNLVNHLVYGLPGNHPAAVRAVRDSDSGIQKAEIIVDFRYRSHRRTGIPVGGFLIDGNCRGKSVNPLYVRLFHLSQKHSRVGGQRFHISSLPFCINRIKGKGGFAGT